MMMARTRVTMESTNSHPEPAMGRSRTARIISTLNAIDHPSDLRTITGMEVDVTLMRFLQRSLWNPLNYFVAGRLFGWEGWAAVFLPIALPSGLELPQRPPVLGA